MRANGNMDARHKSAGCISVLRSKQKMVPLFKCCDVKVVILYFRRLINENSCVLVDCKGALDKHMLARTHVDSDMQQIERLIKCASMQ